MRKVWEKGGDISGKGAYLFRKGSLGHRKRLFQGVLAIGWGYKSKKGLRTR